MLALTRREMFFRSRVWTGTFAVCAVLALSFSSVKLRASVQGLPEISTIGENVVEIVDRGIRTTLQPGSRHGGWTFMGAVTHEGKKGHAVFEDFSALDGELAVIDETGNIQTFPKSSEPTSANPASLYRGHTLAEVVNSDHDLLGSEILAQPGDPHFEEVAAAFAPITRMDTYAFVGTPGNADKVGVAYGGRTANFDPAVWVPAIHQIRADRKVLDGLVGGWLPVLRFVYPERAGDWSELVMFAPLRTDENNPRIQPVWYRVCRVERNELKWVKYFDSYPPSPPRAESRPAADFFQDLLALREGWEATLASSVHLDVPDQRLANQARHSLVRAMITRMDSFPKYGVLDRNYGGSEHDGFQDTFNVDTTAMLEWGLFDRARDSIDNYFTHFVRDDGAILYRGPETGQYGRMLTVVAQYFRYTGDSALLLKHRARIDAIANLLLSLREQAKSLPRENPAYGMIAGWCEADSCLEADPARYVQPYLSNSSEAVRGFRDLGEVWAHIGQVRHATALEKWGERLRRESQELSSDLQTAIQQTLLPHTQPPCLPVIAGAREPFDVAAQRDPHDPQFRAYRANMELLYSGCLTADEVNTIVSYREAHRDILLGVPTAYGFNSHELAGFLSYGHAYGLLQYDHVREFLLELYSLSAHQYTRGTWTAPETRRVDPKDAAAPYCVPAQLSVPLLLRWLLAFEDPSSDTLWLCKAVPRTWLEDGKSVAVSALPTRWGKIAFQIQSHWRDRRIDARIALPVQSPQETKLRLRSPDQRAISAVELNGKRWNNFDPISETITLPEHASGTILLTIRYGSKL